MGDFTREFRPHIGIETNIDWDEYLEAKLAALYLQLREVDQKILAVKIVAAQAEKQTL